MTYNKPSAIAVNAAEAIQTQSGKVFHIVPDSNLSDPTRQTSSAYEAEE